MTTVTRDTAPARPSRHARLFELIRQGNMAEQVTETRLMRPQEREDTADYAARAAGSFAA